MLKLRQSFDGYLFEYITQQMKCLPLPYGYGFKMISDTENKLLKLTIYKRDNFPDDLNDYRIEKLDELPMKVIQKLDEISTSIIDDIRSILKCGYVFQTIHEPVMKNSLQYAKEIVICIEDDEFIKAMRVLYEIDNPKRMDLTSCDTWEYDIDI